jgi:LysR family transcriptional regulator, hydrogen peroxide-inducible genes activator
MNLQQLEYILAVDHFRSFSKAAEHCHVTQATLSAMVKKLEEELNVVLFDRKSSPILTTDCGKDILQQAKLTVHHAQQVKETAMHIKDHIGGKIKIGILPTIANSLLPAILKDLLKVYKDLQFTFVELTTNPLIESLKSGKIDAGILSTPLENKELEEYILYYEPLLAYGEVLNEKTYQGKKISGNESLWLLEEGHCLRNQTLHYCGLQQSSHLTGNFSFEAGTLETLMHMVDLLGGITLIPELYYHHLCQEKKSKCKKLENPVPVREISLVVYRPYAKFRIVEALAQTIQTLTSPLLSSKHLKNVDMEMLTQALSPKDPL